MSECVNSTFYLPALDTCTPCDNCLDYYSQEDCLQKCPCEFLCISTCPTAQTVIPAEEGLSLHMIYLPIVVVLSCIIVGLISYLVKLEYFAEQRPIQEEDKEHNSCEDGLFEKAENGQCNGTHVERTN